MTQVEVYKFGGVAVGSAEAIRVAISHIRNAKSRIVAVVSAMNGVTDLLLACARAALEGDRKSCRHAAAELQARHVKLIEELANRRSAAELLKVVDGATREVANPHATPPVANNTVTMRRQLALQGGRAERFAFNMDTGCITVPATRQLPG